MNQDNDCLFNANIKNEFEYENDYDMIMNMITT